MQDGLAEGIGGQFGKGGIGEGVSNLVGKEGINRAERKGKDDKGGYV